MISVVNYPTKTEIEGSGLLDTNLHLHPTYLLIVPFKAFDIVINHEREEKHPVHLSIAKRNSQGYGSDVRKPLSRFFFVNSPSSSPKDILPSADNLQGDTLSQFCHTCELYVKMTKFMIPS